MIWWTGLAPWEFEFPSPNNKQVSDESWRTGGDDGSWSANRPRAFGGALAQVHSATQLCFPFGVVVLLGGLGGLLVDGCLITQRDTLFRDAALNLLLFFFITLKPRVE